MRCPRCSQKLVREQYHRKILFRCPDCRGQFVTLAALRGLSRSKEFVNKIWLHGTHSQVSGVPCPDCGKTTREVLLFPTPETALELDVCTGCRAVWFDCEELESIPLPEPPKDDLPQEAKVLLAERRVKRLSEMPDEGFSGNAPDTFWKTLPLLMGLPVEKNTSPLTRYPLFTWVLTVLCIALFCLSLQDLSGTLRNWGFIPTQWSRLGGATIISSMFLHGSWGHLVGNMYFFLTFGDNVEDEFGYAKYLFLIFISGLFAVLTHFFLNSSSTLPCIGASGFISGVIACYAILFPKVKISFLLAPRLLYFGIVNVPAWAAFGLWIIFQIIMALAKTPGTGGTAYSAHIGGAVAGLVMAFWYRFQSQK